MKQTIRAMLRRPTRVAQELASARVLRQFATSHHLVYFGVVHGDDEYNAVRGATAMGQHVDSHYIVGTVQGRDMIVLTRHSHLSYPNLPSHDYKWLVMQFDLNRSVPHIFLDTRQLGEVFYANLHLISPQLQDMTSLLAPADSKFVHAFRVCALPAKLEQTSALLRPELANALAEHFSQFNFELDGETLLVYAKTPTAQRAQLDSMLRAGLWLAAALES